MDIVKDGTRAAEIISRIRLLFKKGTPQRELLDINEVIREMTVLLRGELARYFISVRTELGADLPQVMGDRVQLQQVMMNVISNSIDAMKDVDGTRELAIKSQRADNELMVSVSDTGVGAAPAAGGQIFNAFFTTKSHGTGMGLSISRSIIESHRGRYGLSTTLRAAQVFTSFYPTKSSHMNDAVTAIPRCSSPDLWLVSGDKSVCERLHEAHDRILFRVRQAQAPQLCLCSCWRSTPARASMSFLRQGHRARQRGRTSRVCKSARLP